MPDAVENDSWISTHTLTWSVTIFCGTLTKLNFISTHTLTWSVTTRFTALTLYYTNFNSHAHVERDRRKQRWQFVDCISTHTLTWSVTLNFLKHGVYSADFNSHAHVERDSNIGAKDSSEVNFNSHAHVERDT